MLSGDQISELARRLDTAEQTRSFIRQFTIEHPDLTLQDAYAVQRAWVALKLARGRVVRGHKIGLTSRAMQSAVGIAEPDYGVVLDDMLLLDGAIVPAGRFIAPRVEVELAFVLGRPLRGPGCTIFHVLDATAYVTPALEILDSRMHRADPQTKATRTVRDTIADNAANAAIVTGGRPFKPCDVDLRWVAALCYRNGALEETGVAAGVLNHPANAVAWLVNKLGAHGEGLAADEIVLSGSFVRPIDARSGDTFHADYGPMGSVSCHFA